MTTYGYARVSTGEQIHDLQVNALDANGAETIFTDTISGATKSRPELDRLLSRLAPGDTLMVWRLDRLGRSLKNLIELIDDLGSRDIHFVSLTENLDTTSAMGRCMFHVVGAFAQLERDVISERTKAGMAAAKKRGSKLGAPSKIPDEVKSLVVVLREKKYSLGQISEETGLPKSTIHYICKNFENPAAGLI